jgi:hypothetical protein
MLTAVVWLLVTSTVASQFKGGEAASKPTWYLALPGAPGAIEGTLKDQLLPTQSGGRPSVMSKIPLCCGTL